MVLDTKGLSINAIAQSFKPQLPQGITIEKGGTLFKQGAKNVGIDELNWDDKERVLRLLFAKMNGLELNQSEDVLPPVTVE